jgi:hypothetical protein
MSRIYSRKQVDYIPLFIFFIAQGYLLYVSLKEGVSLQWPHYAGFIMTLICFIFFLFSHRIGVLLTGCICILGVPGIIAFSPAITSFFVDLTIAKNPVRIIRFQPTFIIWLCLHLLVSGRYYNGILSRSYWK